MAENTNPFYELYMNAGTVPIEIGLNGLIAFLCFVGICLNFMLIYVTIKSKILRSPCNILIALYTLSASFLLIGYSVKFFVFLFGFNFISLRTCYLIQCVPLFGAGLALHLQLSIGIDRLFGILCPIWYKMRGKLMLFKILTICSFISNTTLYVFGDYYGASLHWDKQVMCALQDPALQPENVVNLPASLVIYCLEFVCYTMIWVIISCKNANVSNVIKSLMLSLSLVMSIGLICNIGGLIFAHYIMPLLNMDIFAMEYVANTVYTGLYVAGYGSSTPFLFLCSSQYRVEFQKCYCPNKLNVVNVVPKNAVQVINHK